ncbi:hypothetical protein SETIT_7G040100v2 [Setaria italica]|uniref:Uncharacterized protein n=1 Tax=Setaria italica TaxID=4555 RepID=A0A368RRU5_SETIT|nr:hypothetical protein SETIT_7G040100v2 [Setaria italica]
MRYPVDEIQRTVVPLIVRTYDNKDPSTQVNKFLNHGKPFLYWWDLLEGPWELNKVHGWIMDAIKQGIRAITARIPKKVFLGTLDYEIVIDFEDLYRLYHHQHLYIQLIQTWCL